MIQTKESESARGVKAARVRNFSRLSKRQGVLSGEAVFLAVILLGLLICLWLSALSWGWGGAR